MFFHGDLTFGDCLVPVLFLVLVCPVSLVNLETFNLLASVLISFLPIVDTIC